MHLYIKNNKCYCVSFNTTLMKPASSRKRMKIYSCCLLFLSSYNTLLFLNYPLWSNLLNYFFKGNQPLCSKHYLLSASHTKKKKRKEKGIFIYSQLYADTMETFLQEKRFCFQKLKMNLPNST